MRAFRTKDSKKRWGLIRAKLAQDSNMTEGTLKIVEEKLKLGINISAL
jgi:hypothetical protein